MIQKILMFILLLILALVGYKMLQPKTTTSNTSTDVSADISSAAAFTSTELDDIPQTYVDLDATSTSSSVVNPAVTSQPVLLTQSASTPSFACDGRQHCSQMTSCAEATYFIQYFPNTKMDGNHDGIPCEKQWCK